MTVDRTLKRYPEPIIIVIIVIVTNRAMNAH
jgi:hypothetical protein